MAATKHSNPNSAVVVVVFLLLLHCATAALNNSDKQALIRFKSIADPDNTVLTSWNSSSDPCSGSWFGVSCFHNRVTRLVLEKLGFNGGFPPPVTSLIQLRVLSLKENNFSGYVPDLSNLTSLRLLFISHNRFSGDFPASVPSLYKLYRLDMSYNNFSGSIPPGVNRLTRLLTLRLEENGFTGSIPILNLTNLQDFNVSGNALTGEIPVTLSGFNTSSFRENRFLCGPPLKKCKPVSSDPTRPGGAMASPLSSNPNPKPTVASSPSAMPVDTKAPEKSSTTHRSKIGSMAIVGIIIGDVLVLGVVSLLLYCYIWRSYSNKVMSGKSSGGSSSTAEKIVYSSSSYPNQAQYEKGKMVFFDGERRFELEDLLRASAEMLGRGGMGTSYKAILDDGSVVAVKRLKDLIVNSKKDFEQQMEVLARLKHPNLVSLKAYYFARDEKLLVYDYIPNGTLFWLLHGNRGPGRTPLDWTTRLKVAAGAARGLAFIHNSCKSLRLIHGNVKSTNILIDRAGNARVTDFGLSVFQCPVQKSNGYRAPEASPDGRKLTQKSDVYSFGVLLLELLTGKCPLMVDGNGGSSGSSGMADLPRWVQSVVREEWTAEVFDLELMRYKDIEEEMVGLLQIGMACAQISPHDRPNMKYVLKMIEELRGVEDSPSHENIAYVSESPGMSEDKSKGSE